MFFKKTLFTFIFAFSIQLTVHVQSKIFRSLDLKRRPLELEATAMPTEPQALPVNEFLCLSKAFRRHPKELQLRFACLLHFSAQSYLMGWGAAVAQWIRLRLPSFRPGFEFQAHHLCILKRRKYTEKEAGIVILWALSSLLKTLYVYAN